MEPSMRLRAALAHAASGLVGREAAVQMVGLAAVAHAHVLLIGPPGTAKSEVARRVAAELGGRSFGYLLGRFTEPSELFGPPDLARLREGVFETRTEGMLPEAEVAFLDEVFLGSTAILNTLLTILNERRFRRGHTDVAVPLRVCVAASNVLPDEPSLAAFADRFLAVVHVDAVPDHELERLLTEGGATWRASGLSGLADLDTVADAVDEVALDDVIPQLATAVRALRKAGVALSDRRIVAARRLVAAAAALDGRASATPADLWPIVHAVADAADQATAREVLGELLAVSDSEALPDAAAAASHARMARGRVWRAAAEAAIAEPAPRPRVEALLRAVDAGFDEVFRRTGPLGLEAVRERLVALLARPAGARGAGNVGSSTP